MIKVLELMERIIKIESELCRNNVNDTQHKQVVEKSTVTVDSSNAIESRLSNLEEKLLTIKGKQYEQEQLIDGLCVKTTRLEGKVMRRPHANSIALTSADGTKSFADRTRGSNHGDNATGIRLSGFEWLFEGRNNEYTVEYKEYLSDDGSDELLPLLEESKEQDTIFTDEHVIANPNPTPSSDVVFEQSISIEDSISILEQVMIAFNDKQGEQDKLLNHICILITRLEAKVMRLGQDRH
ncbi:hypothetical protein [Brevibacillus choshinensis]|uniref:hypothetical protein n=1 Tax=Brevibacillus choshinensis TaxID=54911 RepID=UPI002E23A25F|nr:hypothetical protein [Brevibacillus choshinensis]